jgi:glucokinase
VSAHLGLDLGGTNIKWVVVDREGTPLADGTLATEGAGGPAHVIERLALAGREAVAACGAIATAGVGVPGIYDEASGGIRFFTNLPGPWAGHPLAAPLSVALGVPVRLINDARAFTLAEARVGAGRGCASLIGVTLGTGIGGGIVLDGRLVLGLNGTAGEIGHQVIDMRPEAPRCGCGNTGCLEAFVGGPRLAEAAGTATPAEAFAADERGDPRARAAVEAWIDHLAIGLANLVTVLTPDRIVLGGGVAEAAARIMAPLRERLAAHVHLTDPEHVQLVRAALGVRAGAIGAALRGLDGRRVTGDLAETTRKDSSTDGE